MPYKKRAPRRPRRVMKKGKRMYRKRGVYRDVKAFKLSSKEMTIQTISSGSPAVATVVTTGVGVGIGNLSVAGNRARFGGAMGISVSNTNQWSQLSTLFDRYKIHGVKYTFIPEFSMSDVVGTGVLPTIKFAYDYDDANIPKIGDIWSRQGRELRLTKPVSVYVRPKVATTLFAGSGVSGFAVQKAPYINCAYSGLPHFGLKFAVKDWYAPASNANVVLRIEATYYVTFREQINIGALGHEEEQPVSETPADVLELNEEVACELKPTS